MRVLGFLFLVAVANTIDAQITSSAINFSYSANTPNIIAINDLEYNLFGIIQSQNGLLFSDDALLNSNDNTKPILLDRVLNYPNPFRYKQGTEIHYTLNKDAAIQLRIYNILGREVAIIELPVGHNGGTAGANIVKLRPSDFGHSQLSAGLYYLLVIANNKILGKGKLLIKP